jgi:hypothetical protein
MRTKFWSEKIKGRSRDMLDNIKIYEKETRWEGLDWIHVAQNMDLQ